MVQTPIVALAGGHPLIDVDGTVVVQFVLFLALFALANRFLFQPYLQLRERRKSFRHRRDTLERVQIAGGELETRLDQLEAQDQRLVQQAARLHALSEALREHACAAPLGVDFSGAYLPPSALPAPPADASEVDLPLFEDIEPIAPQRVRA